MKYLIAPSYMVGIRQLRTLATYADSYWVDKRTNEEMRLLVAAYPTALQGFTKQQLSGAVLSSRLHAYIPEIQEILKEYGVIDDD